MRRWMDSQTDEQTTIFIIQHTLQFCWSIRMINSFGILVQYKMYSNAQKVFGQVLFFAIYFVKKKIFSKQHSLVIFALILMK